MRTQDETSALITRLAIKKSMLADRAGIPPSALSAALSPVNLEKINKALDEYLQEVSEAAGKEEKSHV